MSPTNLPITTPNANNVLKTLNDAIKAAPLSPKAQNDIPLPLVTRNSNNLNKMVKNMPSVPGANNTRPAMPYVGNSSDARNDVALSPADRFASDTTRARVDNSSINNPAARSTNVNRVLPFDVNAAKQRLLMTNAARQRNEKKPSTQNKNANARMSSTNERSKNTLNSVRVKSSMTQKPYSNDGSKKANVNTANNNGSRRTNGSRTATSKELPRLTATLRKQLIAEIVVYRFPQMCPSFFKPKRQLHKLIEHVAKQSICTIRRHRGGTKMRLGADASRVILHSMPADTIREFIARLYNTSLKQQQRTIYPGETFNVKVIASDKTLPKTKRTCTKNSSKRESLKTVA